MAEANAGGFIKSVAGVITTNPLIDAVLVDGGALPTGTYDVRIVGTASAAASLRLEYRNAANDTTITAFPFYLGASAPVEFILRLPTVNTNERFRVAMQAGLTGTVVAHLNMQRVA